MLLHRKQSAPSLIIHQENKIPLNLSECCLAAQLKASSHCVFAPALLKDSVKSLAGTVTEPGRAIVQPG